MQLTKKAIEKKYNVRLERGDFDLADDYKSWFAYKYDVDDDCETEVAWCYTLAEIVEALEMLGD